MAKVALIHRTLVPKALHDDFIKNWEDITRHYGAPDATLHQTKSGQFIQLVIWSSREEADAFTKKFVFSNETIKKYLQYTKRPQEITVARLTGYRAKLPQPLITILK